MGLFYLIYKSEVAAPFSHEEIDQLEGLARNQNSKFQITGLLIKKQNLFVQYLEGSKKHISRLYENNLQDKRHSNIKVLDKGFVSKRRYPHWSMLIKHIDLNEINKIENNKKMLAKVFKNPEISDIDAIKHLIKTRKFLN